MPCGQERLSRNWAGMMQSTAREAQAASARPTPFRVGADRLPTPEQPVRLKSSSLPWFCLEQERVVGADLMGSFENRCLPAVEAQSADVAGDAGDGGSKVLSNSPHTSASAWESLANASGSSMGTAKAERPDCRHARKCAN